MRWVNFLLFPLTLLALAFSAAGELPATRESTDRLELRIKPGKTFTIKATCDQGNACEPCPPNQPCPPTPPCPPKQPCPPAGGTEVIVAFLGDNGPSGERGDSGTFDGKVGWQLLTSMSLGFGDGLVCKRLPAQEKAEVQRAFSSTVEHRTLVEDRPMTKAERMKQGLLLAGCLDVVCVPLVGPAEDGEESCRCKSWGTE